MLFTYCCYIYKRLHLHCPVHHQPSLLLHPIVGPGKVGVLGQKLWPLRFVKRKIDYGKIQIQPKTVLVLMKAGVGGDALAASGCGCDNANADLGEEYLTAGAFVSLLLETSRKCVCAFAPKVQFYLRILFTFAPK